MLGPLDLNLLGLEVHLNQVELDIVAVPGGGLLGDLLCAVANLLNPLGSLIALLEALNDLLDFFDGFLSQPWRARSRPSCAPGGGSTRRRGSARRRREVEKRRGAASPRPLFVLAPQA